MSTPTPASPAPGKRKYPRALILSIAAVLLLALLLLWQNSQQRRKEQEMAEKLAAIRAQGFPVSASELNAWYPEPPVNQNAAIVYGQAFSQMALLPWNNPWFIGGQGTNIFNRTDPIPPQARIDLSSLVTSNLSALQLLHDGAKLTNARYPVNLSAGHNVLLPHHSQLRYANRLLSAEALDHALNDRTQPAVDSLITAFRLGHSVSNEPVILSYHVQVTAYTETVRAVENILHRTAIPSGLLPPLAAELERAENSLNLTRALAGERSNGFGMFEAQLAAFTTGTSPTFREAFSLSLFKASGLQDSDIKAYLHFMNASILASQKPPEEMTVAFHEVEVSLKKQISESRWKTFLTGMFMPSIIKNGAKKVETIARLRLARLALLLLTYQSKHAGQLPDSLTALPQVPLDPFDGKPLRYRRTETGFLLWSIGPDNLDQGGQPRPQNSTNDAHDLVFTVERATP